MADDTQIREIPEVILVPPALTPPVVVPVVHAVAASDPPPVTASPAKAPKPHRAIAENALITLLAWVARFVVGVFMICSIFPLSLITSIAAFGWLQRRMQAIALRGWWRESPRRREGTFQAFCDSLGPDGPVERPRWFWRERVGLHLAKIGRVTSFAGIVQAVLTLATLPIHSLWLNFKLGIAGLFTTYLLTGWGCSIMLFSWYFGWHNSFNKGYEDVFLGPFSGLFGSLLLILALIYVPMAQAHQAAAGEIAAFFQFRVVTRLILTRLTPYTLLIAGLALVSLVFEIPRVWTARDEFAANDPKLSPQEALWVLERHWLLWSVPFFFSLLALRTFAALIYRSAMLKAVRSGTVLVSDLPPRLGLWFEKLEIFPQLQAPQPVLLTLFRKAVGWNYRSLLFCLVFLFWVLFVMRFYVGIFLVFNGARGILNHPVIQAPSIDWTPWHLVTGHDE